jgi:hypothetical protein
MAVYKIFFISNLFPKSLPIMLLILILKWHFFSRCHQLSLLSQIQRQIFFLHLSHIICNSSLIPLHKISSKLGFRSATTSISSLLPISFNESCNCLELYSFLFFRYMHELMDIIQILSKNYTAQPPVPVVPLLLSLWPSTKPPTQNKVPAVSEVLGETRGWTWWPRSW